jgi:hypothetical protein
VPNNPPESTESTEKLTPKAAEKNAQIGVENVVVSSNQVKQAQSTNKDMPSGSAGPSDGGSMEVHLSDGKVVSRKNPLTRDAQKKANEASGDNSEKEKLGNKSIERKRDNKANTHILKALASDHSLSEDTRKFVKNIQEIRTNSKEKGLSTAAIDETAGEMLSVEIRDLKLREASLDKYSKSSAFPKETYIPLPDIKTFMPGSMPSFVSIKLGPEDDPEILRQFTRELEKRDQTKLSDFDREKLHDIVVCDVLIQKYQDALVEKDMSAARTLPPMQQGSFLCKAALLDGACMGGVKTVIHKIIAENEINNQMDGLAVGILLGKTVGILATQSNLVFKGIGLALQAGGLALAAEQIGEIGAKYAQGFTKVLPALQELTENPNTQNFENAKHLVQEELGPPIAETALFASGLAAGHAADRILGKIANKHSFEKSTDSALRASLAGAGRFWDTLEEKIAKPLDKLEPGDIRVVKQFHRNSCVAAVGDMLTNGKFAQLDLITQLNKHWGTEFLKRNPQPMLSLKALSKELGANKWEFKGDYDDSMEAVNEVLGHSDKPFGVIFKVFGEDPHAVVIDGVTNDGLIKVRDPDGKYYKMTKNEFKRVWSGLAILPRK